MDYSTLCCIYDVRRCYDDIAYCWLDYRKRTHEWYVIDYLCQYRLRYGNATLFYLYISHECVCVLVDVNLRHCSYWTSYVRFYLHLKIISADTSDLCQTVKDTRDIKTTYSFESRRNDPDYLCYGICILPVYHLSVYHEYGVSFWDDQVSSKPNWTEL